MYLEQKGLTLRLRPFCLMAVITDQVSNFQKESETYPKEPRTEASPISNRCPNTHLRLLEAEPRGRVWWRMARIWGDLISFDPDDLLVWHPG